MRKELMLEIPGDLYRAIKLPSAEVPRRLKRELAVRLYDKGLLTFGKARELAEMTRWDFHDLLGEEGVLRRYDMEELEEDLAVLEGLD
jgi:predicted HTH domain antitoxin